MACCFSLLFLLNYSHSSSSFSLSLLAMCWVVTFKKKKKNLHFFALAEGVLLFFVLKSQLYICHSFSLFMDISLSLLTFVSHHTQRFSVMPPSTDFNLHIYTSTHAHVLSWGHVAASWNSPLADLVSQMTQWKWPVLSSAASQLHTITCFNVPCNNLWAALSVAFVPQLFFFLPLSSSN